jgi:peptidoglycan-associated lipoprotein
MFRLNERLFLSLSFVLVFVVAFGLGACSKKVSKGSDGTSERMEQEGQRDAGYADEEALQDIFFDFDRSDIRDDARVVLQQNAEWMKSNSSTRVQIEGHCDERGTEGYNLSLGERRANAVKNYLISLGVGAERLYTISYGEELPLDPGHTEEAWGKNRRAHFLVTR